MELKNKRIKVIFLDGNEHYSKKVGIFLKNDNDFLWIRTDSVEIIPKSRIIRMEVLDEGQKNS